MTASLIQTDPSVMMGKPVVAGTRITVEFILEKLAAGESIEQVVEVGSCLGQAAGGCAPTGTTRRGRGYVVNG